MIGDSRLLAFDLDGTLVDSQRDLADSTNAVLRSLGAEALPVPRVVAMVGDGARVLVARALQASGLGTDDALVTGALARFHREYEARLVATTRPYAGVVPMLETLAARGATLAVLTNKPQALAERLLNELGLRRWFAWTIGGDTPFGRKPDPAGLRALIDRVGATPASARMIGDSPIDLETARRAGVGFVAARYGFGRLRGELVLAPGDAEAGTAGEIAGVVTRWLDETRRADWRRT
ncbi:MAG: HAD-IA family hydrolase [Vicinamibacterales bacterium]